MKKNIKIVEPIVIRNKLISIWASEIEGDTYPRYNFEISLKKIFDKKKFIIKNLSNYALLKTVFEELNQGEIDDIQEKIYIELEKEFNNVNKEHEKWLNKKHWKIRR